jgi:uncharacterized protein (TIGR03066 family)
MLAPSFVDKPEELLIGKWAGKQKAKVNDKEVEYEMMVEFTRDGTVKMEVKGAAAFKVEGTYKVIDAKTLEVTLKDSDGDSNTNKSGFKVTKDKLTLIDPSGKETLLTRVTR